MSVKYALRCELNSAPNDKRNQKLCTVSVLTIITLIINCLSTQSVSYIPVLKLVG